VSECSCGHQVWHHTRDSWRHTEPCSRCLNCGREKPGPGRECCLTPRVCPCRDFRAVETAGAA
jgi:hypothetical protein